MGSYTLKLPDPVIAFVKNVLGYDLDSYVDTMLIKPLMEHYEEDQKQVELKKVEKKIKNHVEDMRGKIKLDRVIEVVEEAPVDPKQPKKNINVNAGLDNTLANE